MTYRPNVASPLATLSQAGVFKPDGVTISVAADATASVIGVAATGLTDISSGLLGGPALTDIDVLNRAGADYRTTQAARASLFRRTPAGSRSALFSANISTAVLTAQDNDRIVVLGGGAAGTLTADGSVADGFVCWVRNRTGSPLAFNGIKLVGGGASLPDGTTCIVSLAGATLEAAAVATANPATTAAAGVVKPDGVSMVVAQDGTLSVVTKGTNALPAGSVVAATDLVRTYSAAGSQDVSYTVSQFSAFAVRDRAAVTDARFYGIERVDLRARYGAPLDGASHPLSALGLAAAQAKYPNAGLTSGTDLTKVEQDTAAWLQAEFDGRTGPGAVVGLAAGARMMVSQQLFFQDASKVHMVGMDGVKPVLFTAGCGTVPAIRLSNGNGIGLVLANFGILAQMNGVSPSTSGGGVAHTLFTPGASAIQIDNCQGIDIERVGWNGYDQPFVWGDNTYGIAIRHFAGSGCNAGFSWNQTTGLNSMERIRLSAGALANNNIGFYDNSLYSGNSQGGSIFIDDCALDYNILRAIDYTGEAAGNSFANSALFVTGCHIETTGSCSGTAPRIVSQGPLLLSNNKFYEADAIQPTGIIQVADSTPVSVFCNSFNMGFPVPICVSTTSGTKRVEGAGNVLQDAAKRPILLQDMNGTTLQPSTTDGRSAALLFNDINQSLWSKYYGQDLMFDYFSGPGVFTLPDHSSFAFPVNHCIRFWNAGATTVTFAVQSGGTLTSLNTGSPRKLAPGASAIAIVVDTNAQWALGGGVTA